MLDLTTDKGRIVSAALGLAAEKPWGQVTLAEIAVRAGTTLVALKQDFASKGDILSTFARLVDDEVLRLTPQRSQDQSSRDALFEVLMSRFDVLDPYKPALRSIARSGAPELQVVGQALCSQRWMLEAAGINSGGIEGAVRTLGLTGIYASVARAWLNDDDPGQAKTMAVLDRRLRTGQRTLEGLSGVGSTACRIGSSVLNALGRLGKGTHSRSASEPPRETSAPSA
ncbi:MAG: TetR family transcriptional regulator [Hyphomicrobiaceae bacterium]